MLPNQAESRVTELDQRSAFHLAQTMVRIVRDRVGHQQSAGDFRGASAA
jgi:hypothetical protein